MAIEPSGVSEQDNLRLLNSIISVFSCDLMIRGIRGNDPADYYCPAGSRSSAKLRLYLACKPVAILRVAVIL